MLHSVNPRAACDNGSPSDSGYDIAEPSPALPQLRALTRKEENKYCFECRHRGIVCFVDTTVNTFVCTTCAGFLYATACEHVQEP
jgi:hypothetical protein